MPKNYDSNTSKYCENPQVCIMMSKATYIIRDSFIGLCTPSKKEKKKGGVTRQYLFGDLVWDPRNGLGREWCS